MYENIFKLQKEFESIFSSEKLTNWIHKCEREDAMWKFYKSRYFRAIREEVLKEQHYECQKCREKGKITKADTVHHVNHVRDCPSMALTALYEEDGEMKWNMIAICKACHSLEHPEKLQKTEKIEHFENEERW